MRITRILQFFKNLAETRSVRASWVLSRYGKLPLHLLNGYGRSNIRGLPNVNIFDRQNQFLIRSLPLLKELFEVGFTIEMIDSKGLCLRRETLVFSIKNWEEVFIINEVFHNLEYHFKLSNKCRVVDIGGNIGVASMYFASLDYVAEVTAYELFPDTALRFRETLENNPMLAPKIKLEELGIADSDAELELEYCAEVKGSVGLFGVGQHAVSSPKRLRKEKRRVKVVAADSVFSRLLEMSPSLPLIAKIDCEGAEYQIIENLANSGLLSKVEVFLIEWHGKGHEPISDRLAAAGHCVWLRTHPGADHGMIYSCRRDGSLNEF